MSLNKIMHRYLVDVDNDLHVNLKFKLEAKNRAIHHELNAKKIASHKLKRNRDDCVHILSKKKQMDD